MHPHPTWGFRDEGQTEKRKLTISESREPGRLAQYCHNNKINLKDEYYEAARAYSRAENISLSQAVNRLLAIAFQKSTTVGLDNGAASGALSGFPRSKGAKQVTSAMIEAIEQDA